MVSADYRLSTFRDSRSLSLLPIKWKWIPDSAKKTTFSRRNPFKNYKKLTSKHRSSRSTNFWHNISNRSIWIINCQHWPSANSSLQIISSRRRSMNRITLQCWSKATVRMNMSMGRRHYSHTRFDFIWLKMTSSLLSNPGSFSRNVGRKASAHSVLSQTSTAQKSNKSSPRQTKNTSVTPR